jgi:hypothetical protein
MMGRAFPQQSESISASLIAIRSTKERHSIIGNPEIKLPRPIGGYKIAIS